MQIFNIDEFNKTECVIFDFDDTLYTQLNKEENYLNYVIKTLCDILTIDNNKAIDILKNFDFFNTSQRPRLTAIMKSFGNEILDAYNQYRINNFYMPSLIGLKKVSNSKLKSLKDKCIVCLVSGEYELNVEKKADAMKIDLSLFDYLAFGNIEQKKEKEEIYKEIIQKFGVSSEQVLVIGDRYMVDIDPIVKLGGGGVLVNNSDEATLVINEIIK